jgi:putative ABC transport system substrate-binding protein
MSTDLEVLWFILQNLISFPATWRVECPYTSVHFGGPMARRLIGLIIILVLAISMPLLAGQGPRLAKVPRIGVLWFSDPWDHKLQVFSQALRELGWVEGHNLRVEFRYAHFRVDQLLAQATELVRLPVDVIIATTGPATMAAQQATRTIPIVMMAGDPIGEGFVANLPHPGGNVTGVSDLSPELSAKRLELLREAVPTIARVAVLWCPEHHANLVQWQEAQVAARVWDMTLQSLEVRELSDLVAAFAAATRDRADGFLILDCPLFGTEVIHQVLLSRRPAIYPSRSFVYAGGLMAYGPSMTEMLRRAAAYADKILKGAKPADLPAEQPMTFELVINPWAAKTLGLTIPPWLRFQADEVIR